MDDKSYSNYWRDRMLNTEPLPDSLPRLFLIRLLPVAIIIVALIAVLLLVQVVK